MTRSQQQRINMVKSQIKPNDVYDESVLDAFKAIKREDFVPLDKQNIAYLDEDLPLISGRYLMEPVVFARLVQAAITSARDYALVVGCNMGYGTAVLSKLCTTVVGLDEDPDFCQWATENLTKADCTNAAVFCSKLNDGYAEEAPYDIIIVEGGAVAKTPEVWLSQLKDNGRLLAVERTEKNGAVGVAVCYLRQGDLFSRQILFDANTPWLKGFEPESSFSF